jgi:hypothetical protein
VFRTKLWNGVDQAPLPPNTKAEMNKNTATWRLLEKKLTDWMRQQRNVTSDVA